MVTNRAVSSQGSQVGCQTLPSLTIEHYGTLAMGGVSYEVVSILLQLIQVDDSGSIHQCCF